VGLGHDFLRHIQRTRVIHLLDGLAEDPLLDFAQINSELALFDPDLAKKPQVVALNKMDLPDVQARWPKIKEELKRRGNIKEEDLFAISAVAGTGLRPLLYRAARRLEDAPEPKVEAAAVYRKSDPRSPSPAPREAGRSRRAINAADQTYWEYDQSVRRFQRILRTLGIEDALARLASGGRYSIHREV
jgi:GTP-binding protein